MKHTSPITTHILDTSRGKPAVGVTVVLAKSVDNDPKMWRVFDPVTTNEDGRVAELYPADEPFEVGWHRLRFEVGDYFAAQGVDAFYPYVEITFNIESVDEHYHVPLLLNPFGYSTYRGS